MSTTEARRPAPTPAGGLRSRVARAGLPRPGRRRGRAVRVRAGAPLCGVVAAALFTAGALLALRDRH